MNSATECVELITQSTVYSEKITSFTKNRGGKRERGEGVGAKAKKKEIGGGGKVKSKGLGEGGEGKRDS